MATSAELRVTISADGTEATLFAPAGLDALAVQPDTTAAIARQAGVAVDAPVATALKEFASAYGGAELSMVIARATPAVAGANGRMEWASGIDPSASHRNDDAGGRSDHYAGRTYVRVNEGATIGVLHKPTEAVEGRDVRGRAIKAAQGRPAGLKIHPTLQVDDSGRVTAKVAGVLTLERNELRISQILEVGGGVDFSTGNIDFEGNVTIAKGVCAGFKVRAKGDLTIGGLIEAADIACSGGLSARTGMAGQGRGTLTVGGDAHMVYLEQVRGAVRGNLTVDREISDCRLIVGGKLCSPGGTIMGGEVAVTESLVVKVLGAVSGTPTTIVVDDVPFVRTGRSAAAKAVADAELRLGKLTQEERTIRINPRPSPSDKERLTELAFEIEELRRGIEAGEGKLTELGVLFEATRMLEVNVVGVIHAGVVMRIGSLRAEFRVARKGPLWIFRGDQGEPMYRIGSTGTAQPLGEIARITRTSGEGAGRQGPRAA